MNKLFSAMSLVLVFTFINPTPAQAFINLRGVNWQGVSRPGSQIESHDLSDANLRNTNLRQTLILSSRFNGADLSNTDMTGAIVARSEFDGANFTNANLTDTDWREWNRAFGANLIGANLTGGSFGNTNFMIADFTQANLTRVNFAYSYLNGANLRGANIDGANLSNANLSDVTSGGLTGTPASLPTDWHLVAGYLVGPGTLYMSAEGEYFGPGANLSGANLTNLNFDGMSIAGCNLVNATVQGLRLGDAIIDGVKTRNLVGEPATLPSGVMLINGSLVGHNLKVDGSDLRSADLSNMDLSGAGLHEVQLSEANLAGVSSGSITGIPTSLPTGWKLEGGYLVGPGANLENAFLYNLDLEHASLKNANLNGAALSGAALTGISSGGITGTPNSLPTGWTLFNGYLVGPGANLEGASFKNANLAGLSLSNTILAGVTSGGITGTPTSLPTGWKLIGGYLIGPGANLEGAELKPLTLTGVSSGGITGTPTSLPTGWKLIGGYLIGPGANLEGANFKNLNLAGANLINSTLSGVSSGGITGTPTSLPTGWKLIGGYLIGAGANLQDATLKNANLNGATLSAANLTGVSSGGITGTPTSLPTGWKLIGGYLIGSGANLQDAELAQINLKGVSSGGITGTPTSLPTGWKLIGGYLIGPGANLAGASLANADLTNAEFLDATLLGVSSGGITGTPSSLPTGWKLINGYLIGPGANLTEANLFGLDLEGADLRNANLTRADLRGASLEAASLEGATLDRVKSGGTLGTPASLPEKWKLTLSYLVGPKADIGGFDLAEADLSGVGSGGIIGTPAALPAGWGLVEGYLIGPGANLQGARLVNFWLEPFDLRDADLRNAVLDLAVLTGQNLSGAQLEGASLVGVSSGLVTGTPLSMPKDWSLRSGYLVGPGAKLHNGQLQGVDLSNLNLKDTDFTGALLNGATFANSNLWGARFTGSKISGADFTGSSAPYADFSQSTPYFWTKWVEEEDTGLIVGLQTATPNPTISGIFKVGQTLTATAGNWDSGVNVTFKWFRDGNVIASATDATYLLTIDDSDKQISVEATGSKTGFATAKKYSSATKVAAGTQVLTPTPTVAGAFKVGQTLTATAGNWDQGVTLSYQWLLDGKPITNATKNTYVVAATDLNKQISVEATAVKPGYTTVKKISSAGKALEAAQVLTPTPTVAGAFKVGQTLTATAGNWDNGVSVSFQWLRDGNPVANATGGSFTLSVGDFGKNITLRTTGTLIGYTQVSKESVPSKVAAGGFTVVVPKILGTAKSGSTLNATSSAWANGANITYQWLANGVAIKGATGATFKVTAAYKGKKISVKVIQSALGFTTASSTSATVTVAK